MAKESLGPVQKLVNRGKGLCGVREDADFSVKVCVDLVVGTIGVLKGQDQRGISGRHMDFGGTREGKGGPGKLLGKAGAMAMGVERKRLIARVNSLRYPYANHTSLTSRHVSAGKHRVKNQPTGGTCQQLAGSSSNSELT